MGNLTAKEIFSKQNKTAKELAEGIDILYSGQKDIAEDVQAFIEKQIIDYTNRKIKKQTEELAMRLYLQKLHCKLFHRQKFSVWIQGLWHQFWNSKIFWNETNRK